MAGECVVTVPFIFPSGTGDISELKFDSFSLVDAHQRKLHFKPEDEVTLSFHDGRLMFTSDVASYCKLGYRIDCSGMVPSSEVLLIMERPVENFPAVAPTAVSVLGLVIKYYPRLVVFMISTLFMSIQTN